MFNTQPLSQLDPRWSSLTLGFGDADSTLGKYGCTLTCLTMLCNGYGFNETPATLNEKLKSLGLGVGYGGDTRNLVFFTALDRAQPGMRFVESVPCGLTPAPMDRIIANLDANKAVVVQLDQSQLPDMQQHWVLLTGRAGNNILILDPLVTDGPHPITQRYGFVGDAARIITHVIFFDGPAQAPQPVGPLTVVVNSDPDIIAIGGLALRNQPALNGGIIKRLPANFELGLVESEATARPKLGLPGAWLNVATNGSQGFVAAWLVHAQGATARGITKSHGAATKGKSSTPSKAAVQPPWHPITLVVNRPAKASGAKNPSSPLLRSKPSTGKVLAELRPSTPLSIVEPEARALKKIGVRGQWIKVRDNQGRTGYIAGIYVHPKKTKPKAKAKG